MRLLARGEIISKIKSKKAKWHIKIKKLLNPLYLFFFGAFLKKKSLSNAAKAGAITGINSQLLFEYSGELTDD